MNKLICAQILSVLAFILALSGWWLAWVSGLIAMIILLVACCCNLPRMAWIAVTVLGLIAAVGEVLALTGVVSGGSVICGGDSCGGRIGTIIIGVVTILCWLFVSSVACKQGAGSGSTSNDIRR